MWPGSLREFGGSAIDRRWDELMSFSRGTTFPDRPVRIEWQEGNKSPADVIWLDVLQLVISARFFDALAGFTGWSTYPVEVYDGWGNRVPGYAGLVITGRCERVVEDLLRVEGTGPWAEYVGLQFELDFWDGSDLFYPRHGPGPIATAALREALRRAKITNLRATQLPKVRTNKDMVDRMRENRKGPYADNGGGT